MLASVSHAVDARVRYHVEKDGSLVIDNVREAEGVWRYPDLTAHVEYVLELIEATVTRDLPQELKTLAQLHRTAAAIREIVDLPDPKLSLLLTLLVQNRGKLSAQALGVVC